MPIRRRNLMRGAATLTAVLTAGRLTRYADAAQNPATPQSSAGTIRVGVLSDMSGQYAEASGPGDFLAAQIAAEDFMISTPRSPSKSCKATCC